MAHEVSSVDVSGARCSPPCIPTDARFCFETCGFVPLGPGRQLVEEVIGGVKPEVVMVELDSDRICLLPPGEAMAVGLCF